MGKGGKTTKVQQGLDPASQAYVNQQRTAAQNAAGIATAPGAQWFADPLSGADINAAMSPYIDEVIGGVRGEFDHLRGQAMVGTNQDATMAGAFGGSRHGIAQGARLGELDRAQTSQIGGLLGQGYGQAVNLAEMQRMQRQQQLQNPLFAQQQGLNFMNLGMGPVGFTSTTNEKGSADPWGQLAGAALTGAGIYFGAKGRGGGGGGHQLGQSGYAPYSPNLIPQNRGLFG